MNGTVEACVRAVHIPSGRASVADLLPGGPAAESAAVFTAAEAQLCARRGDLTGWAGRLAAKLAVAELLSYSSGELAEIEVLPDAASCPDPGCTRSHPPAVLLHGGAVGALPSHRRVAVSISHTAELAVAVAALTEDHPTRGRDRDDTSQHQQDTSEGAGR